MFKLATSNRDPRARQSLRLDAEMWETIDAVRLGRGGSISRNTWITEANRDADTLRTTRIARAGIVERELAQSPIQRG